MSEWKECKLGDVAELIKETYLPTGSDNIFYIGLEHIQQESLRLNSIGASTDISSNKFKFNKNDILFGKLRPYFRKVVKPQFDGICSTDIWVLKAKEGFNQDFLFYFLANWDFVNLANSGEGGTRMPRANWDFLRMTEWFFPPLSEQKAIAEVLSSLDDKIDLLHRQNKTLEAMAEALFRQWFVELCRDELPEEWKIVNLSDIAEVQNGYSFSSNDYIGCNEAVLEVLKMGHIEKGGGLRANPKRDYVPKDEKLSKHILNKNDIVMAMTDMKDNVVILGVPALVDKSNHYVLNQRVARIFLRSNELLFNNYLLYIQLKDFENIAVLQSKANSGVQVNLTTQTIKDIQIIVPSLNFQIENTQILVEIYSKKETNHSQIHTLEKLRDILLPKLMSGEVRVSG